MTTRLLLVSDTHIPDRAKALPASLLHAMDEADLIVHAGDWTAASVLDELERHGEVLGVYGNNDGPDLRHRLPLVARRRIEGLEFAVVHETGLAATRDDRMPAAYPGIDVLVFGHSHIPWDTTTRAGLRLLNPGSPTDRRAQPVGTFLTATVDGDRLVEVTLVPVE